MTSSPRDAAALRPRAAVPSALTTSISSMRLRTPPGDSRRPGSNVIWRRRSERVATLRGPSAISAVAAGGELMGLVSRSERGQRGRSWWTWRGISSPSFGRRTRPRFVASTSDAGAGSQDGGGAGGSAASAASTSGATASTSATASSLGLSTCSSPPSSVSLADTSAASVTATSAPTAARPFSSAPAIC